MTQVLFMYLVSQTIYIIHMGDALAELCSLGKNTQHS